MSRTKYIVCDALFIALIVIFTFTTYLGYIPLGAVTLTTMHVLVLLGAMFFGWKRGLLYGFIFGLSSLIRAASMPTGPIDMIYINPFISILPRTIFGLLSGFVFDLLKKSKSKITFYTVSPFLCVALTIFHSVITITCLYVFGILDPFKITYALGISDAFSSYVGINSFLAFLGITTLFGMIGESILTAILCPTIHGILTKTKVIEQNL